MRLRTQERTRIEGTGEVTHSTDLTKLDVWAEVIEEKPKSSLRVTVEKFVAILKGGK